MFICKVVPDMHAARLTVAAKDQTPSQQVTSACAGDAVHCQTLDLLTATPQELTRELAQRVMKRLEDTLKGNSEADPVRLGVQGYRARLYEQKFGASSG